MSMGQFMPMMVWGGGIRKELEFLGLHGVEGGGPYRVTGADLGDESTDRVIVIAVYGHRASGTSVNLSSISVNGTVLSNIVRQQDTGSSNNLFTSISAGLIPVGDSGNVMVTTTTTLTAVRVAIWKLIGTGGIETAYDSASNTSIGNSVLNINTPQNGVVLLTSGVFRSGASASASLGGFGATDDFNEDVASITRVYASRHANGLSGIIPASVSTSTGAGNLVSNIAVSW